MQSFFEFLFTVINHHINGLLLFWNNFEILYSNKEWRKIFSLFSPKHCVRELVVIIEFYFQIWKKKELYNIITVISSHMSPMHIDTPYIWIYIVLWLKYDIIRTVLDWQNQKEIHKRSSGVLNTFDHTLSNKLPQMRFAISMKSLC